MKSKDCQCQISYRHCCGLKCLKMSVNECTQPLC
uniref:Uncharacterized protein n=1 Tax=Anguilla anguilla TaxID=7936 RepID=A0A0E9XM02_ANGAN